MAVDQLSLYNDALLILGQRKLASLTEDREPRHRLDDAYGARIISYEADASSYCFELVKPVFAQFTLGMDTPTPGQNLTYNHIITASYVAVIGVFADAALDQPITRYVIEGDQLKCDYDVVYIRLVSDAAVFDLWTPSFARVVSAYLASELAIRIAPDEAERIEAKFKERTEQAIQIELAKVPPRRPNATGRTLTPEWLNIYNDALQIIGAPELVGVGDDSDRRRKLDVALDGGIVEAALEDTGWQFGQISTRSIFDPSAEPAWGYPYAIEKPLKMHRLDGVWVDEHMMTPCKRYTDEGNYLFCDYKELYITYISTDFLVNPSQWPAFFRRMVAAMMAKNAAPSLGVDVGWANQECDKRRRIALSTDAMQSPPRVLSRGDWVNARFTGGFRRRP